jgi:hypothetical protein
VNHLAKDRSNLSCCEDLKPRGMVRLFGEMVVDERDIQRSGLFAQQQFLALHACALEPRGRKDKMLLLLRVV